MMININTKSTINSLCVSADKQFEGHYGSERESQLEAELDKLLEERHYIEVAKIRWIHSDNLLVDALNFLDMSAAKVTQLQQQHEMPSR